MASSYDLYRQAEVLYRQGEAYKKQADDLKVAIAEFSESVAAALTKIGTACEQAVSIKNVCLESPDTNIQNCASEGDGKATLLAANLNNMKSNLKSAADKAINEAKIDADEYAKKADEFFAQSEVKKVAARAAETAARIAAASNSKQSETTTPSAAIRKLDRI